MSGVDYSSQLQGSPPNYSSLYPGIISATQTEGPPQLELLDFFEETAKKFHEEATKKIQEICSVDSAPSGDECKGLNVDFDVKEVKLFMDAMRNKIDHMQKENEERKRREVEEISKEMARAVDIEKTKQDVSTLADDLYELEEKYAQLDDDLDYLREKYQEREYDDEQVEEPAEEEPDIALEDQLRVTEQSAKAIDLLSSHLLSTVWQSCSRNTFGKSFNAISAWDPNLKFASPEIAADAGFYIRLVLLSGSQFKKQLVPETASLIILGILGVLFSAAMQIILAYYLWTRLPQTFPTVNGNNVSSKIYPGTDGGRSYFEWYSPALPAYPYPNYKFANDICRTVPIVQLVTIGLFLFSILNNIPGVIKNFNIIWNSDRFISVDEDGVTKLHFWRESRYLRESADSFLHFLHATFQEYLLKGQLEIKDKIDESIKSINEKIDSPETRLIFNIHVLHPPSDSSLLSSSPLSPDSASAPSMPPSMMQPSPLVPPPDSGNSIAQSTGAQSQSLFINSDDDVRAFMCEMFLSGSIIHDIKNKKKIQRQFQQDGQAWDSEPVDEHKYHAGAFRRRWMLNNCFSEILPGIKPIPEKGGKEKFGIPKGFFEVCEMRSFLAEALRLIDRVNNTKKAATAKDLVGEPEPLLFSVLRDNNAAWPLPSELKLRPQPIQFCDQVRLNLVRIDYLKPHFFFRSKECKWLLEYEYEVACRERIRLRKSLIKLEFERENLKNLRKEEKEKEKDKFVRGRTRASIRDEDEYKKQRTVLADLEKECKRKVLDLKKALCSSMPGRQVEGRATIKYSVSPQILALEKFLGRDFADVLTYAVFSHHCKSTMFWFRFFAFVLGVLPELVTLLMVSTAGVQYILWSGFKVGSDTQGMEEIILATLAISFIYEIDDVVYDHVLPELYKEAHERDRFDITGYWISSETSSILKKCAVNASSWLSWGHVFKGCCFFTIFPNNKIEGETNDISENSDGELCKKFFRCQPILCQTEWEAKGIASPFERGFFYNKTTATKKELEQLRTIQEKYIHDMQQDKDPELEVLQETKTEEHLGTVKAPQHTLNLASITDKSALHVSAEVGFAHQATERNNIEADVQPDIKPLTIQTPDDATTVQLAVKATTGKNRTDYLEKLGKVKQILEKSQKKASELEQDLKPLKENYDSKTKNFGEYTQNSKLKIWKDRFDKAAKNSCLSNNMPVEGSLFVRAMRMSMSDEWNDIYLAHSYPFLYARKLRYVFTHHWWEHFLNLYGQLGMHLIVLVGIALAIVGGYRTLAQCNRFAPKGQEWLWIFAQQVCSDWPNTCLFNVGPHQWENFTSLENTTANEFLAVSCGAIGYIPEFEEWDRNRDYFTPHPPF